MGPASTASAGLPTKTCGHVAPSRRQCDLCRRKIFAACSRACLDAHKRTEHGDDAVAGGHASAVRYQLDANRTNAPNWDLYQAHRARMLGLATAVQRAQGVCVLGAGNCDDVDLPGLIKAFGTVHLVDIDPGALARGRERLPEGPARARVVLHGGVDLAGFLDEVDVWEKAVPSLDVLLPRAGEASEAMVRAIGAGPFDVVVSSCVLTQLWIPLKRTLVVSLPEWNRIFTLISLTHLLTMIKLTRPGGTAVLATDVASVDREPALLAYASGLDRPGLAALAEETFRSGALKQEPKLELLMTMLREHPDLGRLVEAPRAVEPWLWTIQGKTLINYAVLFRRADD